MKQLKTSDPAPRKGGCLRYGATVFFVLGILVYLGMTFTAQTAEEKALRPILLFVSALFVFFIWLMWRPKKQKSRSTPANPDSKSTEDAYLPSEIQVSYINDGHTIYRADDKPLTDDDVEHLREISFAHVQQYYENSPNPKFHRTDEEKMEQVKFYSANSEYIDKLQQDIWLPRLYSFSTIDDAITHAQQALISAQKLLDFCSQTKAGQQYYEDSLLHCHNSQNPDFSFIDRIKDRYTDLTLNYEERKKDFELHQKRQAFLRHADADVLRVIQSNPGILQKNIHKHFDSDLKPTIGTAVSHLVKSGQIKREKQGNSYSLYTK